MINELTQALKKLERYIETEKYKGYDCYDALNSPVLSLLSFNQKILRIAYIQIMKKLPFNLRFLLGIPKAYNPKGLGLILSSYADLYRYTRNRDYLDKVGYIGELLSSLQSPGYAGACWGYNFDWQSRVFFVPKGTPTVVNTSFIGQAFLEAYRVTDSSKYLDIARSACDFIMKDLNHYEDSSYLCFSYTPIDNLRVHNANILGACLLARVYLYTREKELLDLAQKSVAYVIRHQHEDGSWYYAETGIQDWIDSFHTGFILTALNYYAQSTGDLTYQDNLRKGLDFYIRNFFLADGTPKYFHDRVYPIDIHSAAQGIVTLSLLTDYHHEASETLNRLTAWTLNYMQHPQGYFYFQKKAFYTNKIPYIRWGQAWMFYALTHYLRHVHNQNSYAKGAL